MLVSFINELCIEIEFNNKTNSSRISMKTFPSIQRTISKTKNIFNKSQRFRTSIKSVRNFTDRSIDKMTFHKSSLSAWLRPKLRNSRVLSLFKFWTSYSPENLCKQSVIEEKKSRRMNAQTTINDKDFLENRSQMSVDSLVTNRSLSTDTQLR